MSDSPSELSQLNAVISTLQAKINTLDVKVDNLEKKLLNQPGRIDGVTIPATSIKCGNILLDGETTSIKCGNILLDGKTTIEEEK